MNTLQTNPWPHLELDDYFHATLYNACKLELTRYVSANISNLTHHTIIRSQEPDFKSRFPATAAFAESANIDERLLKLFPNHRKYSSLYSFYDISICLGNFSYKLHDEAPWKVLSAVTYIAPSSSKGTLLYDCDKTYVKTTDWRENRTVIFAPIDGITWHSFESTGSYRITVNHWLTRHPNGTNYVPE
jgi:hypothetical protein